MEEENRQDEQQRKMQFYYPFRTHKIQHVTIPMWEEIQNSLNV